MTKRQSQREKGKTGEELAVQFLKRNGFDILEHNYYYRHGEVDIVAQEGAVLVFVEVKFRRSTRFGAPEESVTPKKQELLRRTAEGFVMERNMPNVECRFDVVSILSDKGKIEITHLKDCF